MARSHTVVCVLCMILLNSATAIEQARFDSAQPIWPVGRETEMNLFVGFRAVFECPKEQSPVLRIAASSLYRVYLNGRFIGHGPARGPHGFFRVDEWPLQTSERNMLAIEVAGYSVNSYYLLDQPAFLQAEVASNGTVLASTAGKGVNFGATILKHRVQKVQRYSFQRPFIEYYRMSEGDDRWWDKPLEESARVSCATLPPRQLLARRVAYPRFDQCVPINLVSRGELRQDMAVARPWKDRSLVNIGPQLKGYPEKELEVVPSLELQKIRSASAENVGGPYPADITLAENTFAVVDLGTNLTGFIGATVRCSKPTKLCITFDEILANGEVDFKRLGCVNAVGYELQPGTYHLESFEPYTLRYLKVNVLQGNCEVTKLYLREYANDETVPAGFSCSDQRLNRIFEAARQTFRQNAVDIFMDCPSRERAGWLCDSFFTSRVAFDLCGNTTIEKNFFENYLLPPSFAHLPDGMLPMCYPADHNDGVYIPNWALWFVIELEEYQARSGDREMVAALRPKLEALYKYFQKYKNEDGLLEKLDSWVFIEWSKANDFVRDVSYPTNMLYAAALAAGGRMYNEPSLTDEAERTRETIRKQSFDGEFFVDNAVRKDGKLQVTRNRSEVCQYFAFFFDVAMPQTHKELWEKLVHQFGPDRKKTNAFPEVYPANAFVGNYLRLELLSRYGYPAQIKNELVDYYLYMAEQTGTLWENVSASASCDHGFASHVAHVFYRDILGVRQVDTQNKVVHLKIADVGLDWAGGAIATPDGPVDVRWQKENGEVTRQIKIPAGYTVREDDRKMEYTSGSANRAKAWQRRVRAKLAALLKIDDLLQNQSDIPLAPKKLSSVNKGSYTVEEVEISSTPNRRIRIIVTLPITQNKPVPAVVCIGGHGSDLYSPYDEQTVPKDAAKAQAERIYRGFGTALANKGYVTISTTISQHEVYEKGRLLMGERLWDLMRCVDYLESQPGVNRSRIACAGLSLGGEMAMWLGAMDERIAATVSAGFLTTMDHMEQNHCMCWKFDGLRELVDYADIYSLTAPRPLQCQNGLKEPVSQFYVPLAREAMKEVETIYKDMGKPENVMLDVHEEGHVIDLPALLAFFEKHL